MITLEDALDDCLAQLAAGQVTVKECLARYPQHAPELRRLLAAAAPLQPAPVVNPSASFKARNRTRLIAHIGEHPRRRNVPGLFFQSGLRLAFSLASVVMALVVVGTVAAQSTLPGQALYSWKRASENAWRAIAPDRLSVDINLAGRRAAELVRLRGSESEPIALQSYREALVQVNTYTDPTQRETIAAAIANQKQQLTDNGLTVPEVEQLLSNLRGPDTEPTLEDSTLVVTPSLTVQPSQTPAPTETASPTLTSPAPIPTNTLAAPTIVVPTQSIVLPTLEIPTLIATVLPDAATAASPPVGDVGGLIETAVPDLHQTLPVP